MESSASAGGVASAVLGPRRWWALALVLLVYAVVDAPGADRADVGTIMPLAGSAVLVAASELIESPLRADGAAALVRSPTLARADALTILIGTIAVGMPFLLTRYAQQVLGYSALKFGISPVVLALGATADAIAGRSAVGKAGFRPAATAALALMQRGRCLRRAGPDRPGAGVRAPRSTAEASAGAARAGSGRPMPLPQGTW